MNIVKELDDNGFCVVGQMPLADVVEINMHLAREPWYPNHVKGNLTQPINDIAPAPYRCVGLDSIVTAPHWFEMALKYTPVALDYLRSPDCVLYSMNAFFTNVQGGIKADIQDWHRDSDSSNFIVLFMYLTDVMKPEDGAHVFEKRNGERIVICGPAGTMFFADTRQLHYGMKPQHGFRGLAWARWSADPNPASYGWDKLEPVDKARIGDRYPSDPVMQNIIRKVVA